MTARRVGTSAVLALLLVCVTLTVVRALGPPWHPAVLLASFGFVALPGYLAAALLLLLALRGSRHRPVVAAGVVAALLGATLHAAWLAPSYVGEARGSGDLTVLTLNLRFGRADADEVRGLLDEADPDLVVLTEVTPEAMASLGPLPASLPHVGGRPQPGAAGTVVLSRWALTDEARVPLGNSGHRMTVGVPEEAGGSLTLDAVHAAYPLQETGPWRRDLATVERRVAGTDGPHLVVGDLNATADHAAFRSVLGAGVHDAAERVGAGWQPTWPTPGERGFLGVTVPLAVLPLDHVLVSPDLVARDSRTVEVAGTDHLALVVEVSAG